MTPQPESPEPLKVVAYLTTDEEGSPAMLFFDQQEASNYCNLDEQPARLTLTDDAEAAIQAARNEAEAMRADAERYRWLRDKANDTPARAPMVVMVDGEFSVTWRDARYGSELDAAIDAMKGDAP